MTALKFLVAIVTVIGVSFPAVGSLIFADDFNAGAAPVWGNQRGNWRATSGQYDATNPDNTPLTYSSVTSLTLTDFAAEVTVNTFDDGGLWLRSDFNGGNINGLLLVTGGMTGSFNGFYWHRVINGAVQPIQGQVAVPAIQGTTVNLRVEVIGNTYSLFLNGGAIPVATLITSQFASGQFGLYDYSPTSGVTMPRGQTFDNVKIFSIDVPAPGALTLLGLGLLGLGATRRRLN